MRRYSTRYPTLERRFWSKVNPDGPTIYPHLGPCYAWTAGTTSGYGSMRVDKKHRLATHVAWFLANGEWPTRQVLHHCDNPPCTRIEHLYQGTDADNRRDMVERKRYSRPSAKITYEIAQTIRARYAAGDITLKKLGRLHGLEASTVRSIIIGQTWREPLHR